MMRDIPYNTSIFNTHTTIVAMPSNHREKYNINYQTVTRNKG